jgi:hypothetical protein
MTWHEGAGFKPALLRRTPLVRCSLGHAPTAEDFRSDNKLLVCACCDRAGWKTRPYMNVDLCATSPRQLARPDILSAAVIHSSAL